MERSHPLIPLIPLISTGVVAHSTPLCHIPLCHNPCCNCISPLARQPRHLLVIALCRSQRLKRAKAYAGSCHATVQRFSRPPPRTRVAAAMMMTPTLGRGGGDLFLSPGRQPGSEQWLISSTQTAHPKTFLGSPQRPLKPDGNELVITAFNLSEHDN
ncbi:hypothetical protein B0J13DRAFT_289810 [Dactylonectria estremocensis]|uniref:Uncharacterized protein n=1 Tax=Dactylonectria estremocensis TaxID=1079267 RepID=A0A9P9F2R1_9HYPO|nr:hypothetical protein B0J13DRAFT_289810 [Dactylonectria estremocensis]